MSVSSPNADPRVSPHGWLRYLHRKTHGADDWSRSHPPGPHWDASPDGRPRRDLLDSALAVAALAQRTPAWIEPHVAVLDRLIERHLGWCAAADWLTATGWSSESGTETGSYRSDLLGVDDMIDFKASLLLLLGLRSMLRRDGRWQEPFDLLVDGPRSLRWSYSDLAQRLANQWAANPRLRSEDGRSHADHLALLGLGLRLHDIQFGSSHHEQPFDQWWHRTGGLDDPEPALGAARSTALRTALFLAPQSPEAALDFFAVACSSIVEQLSTGLDDCDLAIALLLAREWGLVDLEEALVPATAETWKPTPDPGSGEVTWSKRGEDLAGRASALVTAAEVTRRGDWTRNFGTHSRCPQIVGVDFPAIALSRAEWIDEALYLELDPVRSQPDRRTTLRLEGAEPRIWYINGIDGVTMDTAGSAIVLRTPVVPGEIVLTPGSY